MITFGSAAATVFFFCGVVVAASEGQERGDRLTGTIFFAMAVAVWTACLYGEYWK